ncbi:hypothetical protein [Curtobacterium flaccumfaciens]|nr:hypothetical protein [Curtobacterium flaccumfaciens]MCX2846882.1 hypothetical protein [Curtobacterium flaccumfaciens pv. oortii]
MATKPRSGERTAEAGTQSRAWVWLVLAGAAVVGLVNVVVIALV